MPMPVTRPLTRFDVLTIGNAIVDVLAHCDETFLTEQRLIKGSMRLIDEAEAERLYGEMGPAHMISGGCAGNTAAGVRAGGRFCALLRARRVSKVELYRNLPTPR